MKDEKEEIKPAPLGEQKKDFTDADVAFANSFQRDNKHYIKQDSLGESSEEQKPRFGFYQVPEGYALFIDFKMYTVDDHFFQRFSTVMQEWESISPEEFYHCHSKGMGKRLRIVNKYDSIDIITPSPTSEPPEEQEELVSIMNILQRYESGMSEYFRMHDYRNLYGLWENLIKEIKNGIKIR